MSTDEYATAATAGTEKNHKIRSNVFLSIFSVAAVAWTKKSGRKIEREARLSGLSSRRVLFSLFFVSNFETDLWNQALPFDQSQRLVFQHAGGLGVQFRFAQFFVLPVCKKQQIDRTVVVRRFSDWFIDRLGLRRF